MINIEKNFNIADYVPYVGATNGLNLGSHNITALTANLGYLNVANDGITGVQLTAVGVDLLFDGNSVIYFKAVSSVKMSVETTGVHIGPHNTGAGTSTYVPLFLYDNYGDAIKFTTVKMATSLGYNAIFGDHNIAVDDFYFIFGTAKATTKLIAVYTDDYCIGFYNSLKFNSGTETLTVGTPTTGTGYIELINTTRTLTLKAPLATYTLTFPVVPISTQAVQLAATGVMSTIANTGSGNNVLSTNPALTTPSITTSCILTRTALGSTPNYGLYIRNTTSSTSGAPVQFSPAIQFFGSGWDTDAGGFSEGRLAMIYLSTATGADVTSTIRFDMDEAGGGSDTKMYLRNNGCLGLDGASSAVAKLSIGGNGIANTGLFVGSTGYSYAQILISDSGGEELFKIKDDISDASFSIGLGDVTDAYSYTSLILTYNKLELTYGDLSIVDKNIILGTTTGTKIGTATTQKLGFYNATPIVQPTALTTALTTITFTAPGTPDYALQDVTNTTPYGFVDAEELRTFISVVKNLQDRVNGLETKLQALGLIA